MMMASSYDVITKFRRDDMVRVNHECDYFDKSVRGVDMVVLEVHREKVDGKEIVRYRTNRADPVHGPFFNEFELIGVNRPLPPRD